MRTHHGCLLALGLVIVVGLETLADFPSQGQQKVALQDKATRTDPFGDPLPDGVFYRLGTARLRHPYLRALIFAADGRQLLSQGGSSLRVWDAATGRLVQELPQSSSCRLGMIASPDDRYLACLEGGTALLLLDKATGKVLAKWEHDESWSSVAFSRDGKTLIGLTYDAIACRWDVASRKETVRRPLLKVPNGFARAERFWSLCPDGTVAAGRWYGYGKKPAEPIRFWDTNTGKECRPPLITESWPWDNCWSPDGRLLALAGCPVEVWDTVIGKRLPLGLSKTEGKGKESERSDLTVAFHPNGKLLAVGSGGTVALLDVNAGKQLWKKDSFPAQPIGVLTFSPDGKILAVGSPLYLLEGPNTACGSIAILETATGSPVGFTRQDPGQFQWSLCFSPDSRTFLTHQRGQLSLRDTATGKEVRNFGEGHLRSLSPDGALVALDANAGPKGRELRVFETTTGIELWRRAGEFVGDVVFATKGKTVALLSFHERVVYLLDAATGREIKQLPHPRRNGKDVDTIRIEMAVSANLEMAATSLSYADRFQTWELATGKKLKEWACPMWSRCTLHFLPDGHRILGTEGFIGDGLIRGDAEFDKPELTCVWDAASGKKLRSFAAGLLALSPDGRILALARDRIIDNNLERTIELRNTETGRLQATVPRSRAFALSPDGHLLAAAAEDGHEVALWETTTGRLVRHWRDSAVEFIGATFSPDGRTLTVMCDVGAILVCDVTGLATVPGKLPVLELKPADVERLWADLGSDDGSRTHRALWILVAGGGQTVQALGNRLRPVELNTKQLDAWIAQLDSTSFKERDLAMRELGKIGEAAEAALCKILEQNPTLEMRKRIELLLPKLDAPPTNETLRTLRAIVILEAIGGAEALASLRALAGGAPGARITETAQASLKRLK